MALTWHDLGSLKGGKGDKGDAGRAFLLYNGTATANGTIANPNNVGLRGGKVDDTLVDQNGDMFYITAFTDAACKLGSKVGNLKGPKGDPGTATAGTQVKVLNESDPLPEGLPKGSVAIVVGQTGITYYVEDGKTA